MIKNIIYTTLICLFFQNLSFGGDALTEAYNGAKYTTTIGATDMQTLNMLINNLFKKFALLPKPPATMSQTIKVNYNIQIKNCEAEIITAFNDLKSSKEALDICYHDFDLAFKALQDGHIQDAIFAYQDATSEGLSSTIWAMLGIEHVTKAQKYYQNVLNLWDEYLQTTNTCLPPKP